MSLIPALPHTFVDGPGNTASGEQVMDNLETIRDGINDTLGTVGIAFPGAPRDGQIFNFHAGNGSLWVFRFNADNDLWEFAGGAPMVDKEDGSGAGDLPGDYGPVLVIPRAGRYIVRYGHRTWHSTDAPHNTILALRQAGAGVADDPGIFWQDHNSDDIASLSIELDLDLAAGNLSFHFSSSEAQGRSRFRYLSVTPRSV
jgi:hypothetical protein